MRVGNRETGATPVLRPWSRIRRGFRLHGYGLANRITCGSFRRAGSHGSTAATMASATFFRQAPGASSGRNGCQNKFSERTHPPTPPRRGTVFRAPVCSSPWRGWGWVLGLALFGNPLWQFSLIALLALLFLVALLHGPGNALIAD